MKPPTQTLLPLFVFQLHAKGQNPITYITATIVCWLTRRGGRRLNHKAGSKSIIITFFECSNSSVNPYVSPSLILSLKEDVNVVICNMLFASREYEKSAFPQEHKIAAYK